MIGELVGSRVIWKIIPCLAMLQLVSFNLMAVLTHNLQVKC